VNEPTPTAEPSEIAGRYDVVSKLGAGAFGTVYKAKDKLLGRLVAVKTIRLDGIAAQGASLNELLDRFQREARVSAQLKHPNIVTIYDIGEVNGLSYLAMEFIDGVGLDKIISSAGRLPVARAASIAAQIADALDYAHKNQVVHRDIKPANVMIEAGDRVKVTDFGIAKTLDSADHLTVTGSLLGTPSYMSPEQARGMAIDGRTDLFALGCILYEMLAGTRAFRGDSITGLIFKIITEEPQPLQELDATLPEGLLAVVSKGLSKAPETRYQTGQEMVADLQPFLASGSTPTLRSVETPTSVGQPEEATRVALPTRRVPPAVPSAPPATRAASGAPRPSVPTAVRPAPLSMPRIAPQGSVPPQRSNWGVLLILGAIGLAFVAVVAVAGWLYWRSREVAPESPTPTAVAQATPLAMPMPQAAPEGAPPTQPEAATGQEPAPEPAVVSTPQAAAAPVALPTPTPRPAIEPPSSQPPPARPGRDAFAFLEQAVEEGNDGAEAGARLAEVYRGGGRSGSGYGTRRALKRRSALPPHTPAERPAVIILHNLARIEEAYKQRTGSFGTLAAILGPVRSLPAGTDSFNRRGYAFKIVVSGDSVSISATPNRPGMRAFVTDETGIVLPVD
jgi:serine/threonine protein kinase